MKILVIYPYFGTPAGSWSTRIYELCRRWVRDGAEVKVITAPYEKSDIRATGFISQQMIKGIELTIINSGDNNRLSVWKRGYRAIIFAAMATYYAFTKKYDVLISSSGPITVGLPMILAKIIRSKKTVFEVRDLWPEGAIQLGKIKNKAIIEISRWFERQCYKYADLVVVASPGMEDGVKKVNSSVDTLVIPNASDIELFDIPPTLPCNYIPSLENKKIIIYAGSLGFMDECVTAILAMKKFISESLALVIIGDGAEKEKLEKIALETGNRNIHFLGLIPKTEVVKWYSIAEASLVGFKNYPILSTCSPNKMFDSFAAGVPVIQNTSGWIKSLIEEFDVGFNVRYTELDEYTLVYNKILNENIDAKKHNSLDLAYDKYSINLLAKKYLDGLYEIE